MSKANAWIPSLALAFSAAALGISGYDHIKTPANNNSNVADLVTTVMPSVVEIGQMRTNPATGEEERAGVGSGFVYDGKSGYIITNNHVIEGAEKIIVTMQGDKKYVAKLMGADPVADIAVLQIKIDQPLSQSTLANSDKVRAGETSVAIGSPRGLSNTVTRGVISMPTRDIGNSIVKYIQSDTTINPGNSGGPLFNAKGEVIGMNTLIFSKNESWSGLGFAIPANTIKFVADKLILNGEIKWGYLGVTMKMSKDGPVTSTDPLAEPKNIVLETVTEDSPADKAGLKEGDIIVSVNGKKVNDPAIVSNEIGRLLAGGKADIGYVRDGKAASTVVTLGERPKPTPKAPEPDENDKAEIPPAPPAIPMPTPKGAQPAPAEPSPPKP